MVIDLTKKVDVVTEFKVKGVEKMQAAFRRGMKGYHSLEKASIDASRAMNRDFAKGSSGGKATPFGIDPRELRNLQNNFRKVQKVARLENMRDEFDSFGRALTMPLEKWRELNNEGVRFNTKGGQMANRVRQLTHGMRGFKMEMLGVMFFGMGMVRLFSRMLKPAAQITGMFEIWGATLQVLFLPIMIELLPLIIKLATWLMNLSPETQKTIGVFALLGLGLGKVLSVVGSVALGIGSLIIAFGGIGSAVTGAIAVVGGWITVLAVGLINAVRGTIKVIKNWGTNWKEVFSGAKLMAGFLALPSAIIGVIANIKIYWQDFADFFKKLWDGSVIVFWKAIRGFLKGIRFIFEKMSGLPLVGDLFSGGASRIGNAISNIDDKIATLEAPEPNMTSVVTGQGVNSLSGNGLFAPATVNQSFAIGYDEVNIRRIVDQATTDAVSKVQRNIG